MRDKFPTDIQPFLSSFECEPSACYSSSSVVANEDSRSSVSDALSSETGSFVPPSTWPTMSAVSPESSRRSESDPPGDSPALYQKSSPETQLVPFRGDFPEPEGTSDFSFLSSLQLSSVPRPLDMSCPLMNPQLFQISDTTPSELDLSLYACSFSVQSGTNPMLSSRIAALRRLRLFGIHLPGPKQEAVMRADTSKIVVHPFFVHAITGLGMHFLADVTNSQAMVRLHAKHGQLAWEGIAEISMGNDVTLKTQAFLQVATASLYGRWFEFSRQYLTKACIALSAAKLQFIPTIGRPPGLTEDVLERLAILSQNIYFENYMFLAVDGKEPGMTVRIEKEFRHELPVSFCFVSPCSRGLNRGTANLSAAV